MQAEVPGTQWQLSPCWATYGLPGKGSCLSQRNFSEGLSGADFPSSLCYSFSLVLCLHFSIDEEDKQHLSLPPVFLFVFLFLHSSCSFKVSPLFHLLFFPSLFFIKTNKHFFSGQLRLPGMPVALTASPNGCGSPAFCEMCSTLFCLSMWLSSLLFWGAFCLFFPAFSVSPHLPKG